VSPAAILIEIRLPASEALETCRRLKAESALRTIPVILAFAPASDEGILAGFDAGADDYVSRCDHPRVLLARLRAAVQAKTAGDLLRETNRCLDETRRMADAAQAAKDEFLASVSHELRSPMTAILGFAELLRDRASSEEDLETLDTIKRNGELLLEIVDELLDLSKLEAGKFQIELGPCSPRVVVNDVVLLLRQRAKTKGLSLEAACEASLPNLIRSDALRLRQIVVNLASNAIKFTEQGGVLIRLQSIDCPKPELLIEVADTGVGIEADSIESLFEPYVQAHSSIARRYGGAGLGLAISRRLARLLGGEITVSSTPGVGSTFRLSLPVDPPLAEAANSLAVALSQ
jgi:signal transduction histidine kinase